MNRLKEKYLKEIVPVLEKELKRTNRFAVPNLSKIIINIGLGEAITNPQALEKMGGDLTMIAGQRAVATRAKKSISNFKLRPGMKIGLKVTLRRDKMWDFLERLITIVLPRVKDFRGVSRKGFDGHGNLSLGITEHTVFPDVDPNKVDKIRGLQIVIVTTARDNDEGFLLLKSLGMPFAKKEDEQFFEKMEEIETKEKKELEKLKSERMAEGKIEGKIEDKIEDKIEEE
jgi:large subunit ribosomal protein L5